MLYICQKQNTMRNLKYLPNIEPFYIYEGDCEDFEVKAGKYLVIIDYIDARNDFNEFETIKHVNITNIKVQSNDYEIDYYFSEELKEEIEKYLLEQLQTIEP